MSYSDMHNRIKKRAKYDICGGVSNITGGDATYSKNY